MKEFIAEFIEAIDYRNEFTTKEFILYTILATAALIVAACGESIVLSLF